MKIKSITDKVITFDNGAKLVQYCPFKTETGYAAFSEIDKEALEFEFRKTIQFDVGYAGGIMFGSVKRMFFIPCYRKAKEDSGSVIIAFIDAKGQKHGYVYTYGVYREERKNTGMKNFEKYEQELKYLMSKEERICVTKANKPTKCTRNCENCKFFGFIVDCKKEFVNWLYEEYKETPVLNVDERRFCKAMKHGWIARNSGCAVTHVYKNKPIRREEEDGGVWWQSDYGDVAFRLDVTDCYEVPIDINENLKFDFIKGDDEEPWSIEALLALDCEH